MKKWTQKLLEEEGYEIRNAKIENVDLSMEDHGCLTLSMALDGGSWGCIYGGYCIGKGFIDADPNFFEATGNGMVYLMRIMDTVGASRFKSMEGMYVRVAIKGFGNGIKIIGNITREKWFDAESFFNENQF